MIDYELEHLRKAIADHIARPRLADDLGDKPTKIPRHYRGQPTTKKKAND